MYIIALFVNNVVLCVMRKKSMKAVLGALWICLLLVSSVAIGVSYDRNKQIIVFDFGGVIGGSHHGLLEAKIAKELKISPARAKDMVEAAQKARNLKVPEKRFWQFFSASAGIKLPKDWPQRFDDMRRHVIRVKPGMMELVEELTKKYYRVAMLSNVTSSRAIAIRELGIYEPFNPAVLSCEIGCSKPDKKAYKILLEKLGNVPARKCIFIDDKQDNIDVAKELGFDAILFTSCDELKIALGKRKIYVKTW